MDTSDLAIRMKEYEDAQKTYLTRRLPVMIRLDGNAFHTYTRKFERPFDDILHRTMNETMKYLCEHISGCVLGYTQSDEITLLLIDYNHSTQGAWFGYVKRKVETLSAAMATMAFNNAFREIVLTTKKEELDKCKTVEDVRAVENKYKKYVSKIGYAMFDSRAWNLPTFEVINAFIWRQNDCTRNSIQSVGQANFSSKQLHKKSVKNIMDMLVNQKGVNWNDFPTMYKRGTCCTKRTVVFRKGTDEEFTRNKWTIDYEIPIFTKDREYINHLLPNGK